MKTTTFQVIIYKFYTNQLSSPDELVTDSSLVSGASKIMRCISLTSKYWAAIFKGTNDHVTSTASKNQKLSEKEGFKNSGKYEDSGIPCIIIIVYLYHISIYIIIIIYILLQQCIYIIIVVYIYIIIVVYIYYYTSIYIIILVYILLQYIYIIVYIYYHSIYIYIYILQ